MTGWLRLPASWARVPWRSSAASPAGSKGHSRTLAHNDAPFLEDGTGGEIRGDDPLNELAGAYLSRPFTS